ncbi:MAG: N-acetylmuramoyl-L-alanine amidase [Actinomycetota bacterium]|nr:N-acetylmuramoyl-L-alanine amidase [Actinomycetota bacterium]
MNKLIREGDRSPEVADIQARLRSLKLAVEDETGWFGESTRRAVREFQQQRGILVDGVIGPHTWSELVEASWRLGDRPLYLAHPPMRGDDVVSLQSRLNALGFDSGREDGIFGRLTDAAVRGFQKEYGVPEDGIFGQRSRAALDGLRVDRPGTAALLREELRRAESPGLVNALVVVDPGHGGTDAGEIGPNGVREADACWALGRRLAERLVAYGARVRLSRTEVESPDSSERARRANNLGAAAVISLHLNSHEEGEAAGSSTYHFISSSAGRSLAEHIQDALVHLGLDDCRSHGRAYTILRETRMPAVLVEPVFVTNPEEEKKLEDPAFLRDLADALAKGVVAYFDEEP